MLILLMIGRILGIILLAVVIIIAVILFVPVRYRLTAESETKQAAFSLRWMFGLVSFRAGYKEQFDYGLRVAGFRVFPREKEKKKKDRKKEAADGDGDTKEKKKPSLKERAGKAVHILKAFHEQSVAAAVFPPLQTFLCRIRPRKLTGYAAFGFADPSVTGRVCGGLAVVPFLFASDLHICPDFETEKTYFDGNVRMRGHIFIIHALLFVFALFRKKEIRKFMHVIRKKNRKS